MYASEFSLLCFALSLTAVKAWPSQSFKSVPFAPPVFNITKSGQPLAPGLLFITTTSLPYPASIIVTDDGELVWSSEAGTFYDLNVQTLDSKPVLTYWNGSGSANPADTGHGYGAVQILDTTYTEIYNICPDLDLNTPSVCQADLHEAYVTDSGSLLVTAYNATQTDLTSVGGPTDGYIFNALFFEIDIKTKEILFSWSAIESVPVSDSHVELAGAGTSADPYDYFHINSIQPLSDGYLINGRNVWTSYKLSREGDIEWRFEGETGGDFTLPSDIHFAWEHQARIEDITPASLTFHIFDNANSQPPFAGVNQTLGLKFSLNLVHKTATLLQDLYDPKEPLYAESQGAFNPLPNGNVLMGYGQIPVIKEYGPSGDVRLSITFGELNGTQSSYRAFRLEWEGVPTTPPVVVVESGVAYMSWNGATEVVEWEIYEGTDANWLRHVKTVKSTGFETETPISNLATFVQVTAITAKAVKRQSATVSVS